MTYEEIVEFSKGVHDQWSVPAEQREKAAKDLEVGQWPADEETVKAFKTAPKAQFDEAVSARQGRMADVTKARETETKLKEGDSLFGQIKSAFAPKDLPTVATESAPVPGLPDTTLPDAPVTAQAPQPSIQKPITLTPSPLHAPQVRPAPVELSTELRNRMDWQDKVALGSDLVSLKKGGMSLEEVRQSMLEKYSKYLPQDQAEQATNATMDVVKRSKLNRGRPDELPPIAEMAERYKERFPSEAKPKFGLPAESAPVPGVVEPAPTVDDHYDYEAAKAAGVTPQVDPHETEIDPKTGQPYLHWDSRFKKDTHPHRFLPTEIGIYDTKNNRITPDGEFQQVATPEQWNTIQTEKPLTAQEVQVYLGEQAPGEEPDLTLPEIVVTPEQETAQTPDWLRQMEPPASVPNVPLQFTDKAGNPLRSAAPPVANSIGQNVTEIAHNYLQGITDIPAGLFKSIAIASKTLDDYLPEAMKNPATVEERMTYKIGQTITDMAREAFPTDPNRQKEFLAAVLPRALGSMTGFLATGLAGTAIGAPVTTTAVAGAAVGGTEGYEDAAKSQADDATKQKSFWLNAAVGTTEALPIERLLSNFNQATGGRFFHILAEGGKTAATEFLQEFFQTTAGNVIAKDILEYDKQRSRLEGSGEAGAAGGASGAIMGVIMGALGGRRAHVPSTHERPEEEEPAKAQTPTPAPAQAEAPLPTLPDYQPLPERVAKEAAELVPEQMEIKKGQPYRIPQERPEPQQAPVPVEQPAAVSAPVPTEQPQPIEKPQPVQKPVKERPQAVERPTPETKPAPVERPKAESAPVPVESLSDMGKAGSAIVDNMYQSMWDKVQKGETTEGGQPSAALQVAKEVYGAGGIENVDDLRALMGRVEGVTSSDLKGAERNQALRDIVEQWTPRDDEGGNPLTQPGAPSREELYGESAPVPLETAAHEAATSPQNDLPEPTQAQKEAGNYQKGHVKIAGLDISIENPQGSTRSGQDASGKPWSVEMQSHYGYIKGTVGKDKDHLDVFVKPGTPEDYDGDVSIVNQIDPKTGRFDEHKIIIGAGPGGDAVKMYRDNYAKDWKGLGSIGTVPMREFKDWLKSGNTKKPFQMSGDKKPLKGKPITKKPAAPVETVLTPEQPAKVPADLTQKAPDKVKEPSEAADIDMEDGKKPAPTFDYTDKGKRPSVTQIIKDWIKAGRPQDFAATYGETEARFIFQAMGNGRPRWQHEGNSAGGINFGEVLKALQYDHDLRDQSKPTPKGELIAKPLGGGPAETIVPKAEEKPAKKPSAAVNVAKLLGELHGLAQAKTLTPEQRQHALDLADHAEALANKDGGLTQVQRGNIRQNVKHLRRMLAADRPDAVPTQAEVSPAPPIEQPEKSATLPAPAKEATREPEQPRVEDARPPEDVSAANVPGVEGGGEADAALPRPATADGGAAQRPRTPRPARVRSDGNAPGRDVSASGDGSADTRATDSAVSRPAKPKPKAEEKPEEPELPAGTDFRLTADYSIPKGAKTKYKANVAAIKFLKQIEHEGRKATPEEQATLAQYTGWGGLPQAFQWSRDWDHEYSELSDLLTQDEYAAARASTPNAHYTDPATIRAIYEGLKHLGFKGGKLLEPGAGVGHFLGSIPGDLRSKTQKTAVEMDSISARIMAQLYQRANVLHSPYQETVIPDNFFDVAVGNVPFANVQVFDPHSKELSKLRLSLHDYYFAKAISQVRPGGLVAFITSRYTLDKLNGKLRDFLAKKADFVGAMRLPNTQFKEIANTDVVTDIIVLQRREDGAKAGGEAWTETKTIDINGQPVAVNEYYANHPEQMLGKPTLAGSMYRDNEFTVEPDGRDMERAIVEAFERLPKKIMRPRNAPASVTPRGLLEAMAASDDVKEGAYTIQNNALYVRRGSQFVPVEDVTPNDLERAKGLIGLRDQTREVFKTQLSDVGEAAMKAAREELNKRYDRFVKKFGPISGRGNKALFRGDPDYPTLQALERKYDPKKNVAEKADIFRKRVIEFKPRADHAATPKDAMLVSMNETGGLDWARMSELTGQSEEDLQKALKGIAYKNPSGGWEPADAYLSGNVRKKLKEAEAAAKLDPAFKDHVEALKAAIPPDLLPSQIDVKLGHGWIPTSVYEAFIEHLFGISRASVKYNATVGAYAINAPMGYSNTKNESVWGTARYPGIDIVNDAMHSKLPTVKDRLPDDTTVVNEKETLAAREKLQKIQDEFRRWLWSDPARAEPLAKLYNQEYNAVRLREYDGSHLTLPGQNPAITLKKHQKDVIWRALQSGNTLLAHVVGAGKTFEMIGIAMESRRLRLANNPMFVVPNHLVEQWRDSILQLYPAAKVLTTTKDDFKKENRRILSGRIATGDWDAVLISHSQMSRLPISLERFQAFAEEQIAILEDYLRELKAERGGKQANRNLTKELEKAKQRLEAKLKARQAAVAEKADQGVTFEETGVDMLLVDEADLFKNLWFPTRMTRVAGLPNTESQRSYDMFLKTQYLNKLTNHRGVIFATGTPVSNSMAEVFTMQRYLQPQVLEESGLQHFDAWARQYGNTVTSMELAPDGSGYRPRSRFAEFVNVPELTQQFRQVMDVKSQEDLNLPVPKLKTGKPINNTYKPSEALVEYTKHLIERAADLKRGRVDPRKDNMLKITGDGRNAALDIRLRVPSAPEDKSGKIVGMVNNVAAIYKRTADVKGTQLIFLDLSTPKGEGKPKAETDEETPPGDEELESGDEAAMRGSVYAEIKKKLIKKGIPEKEIAFIHDANTDARKSKLFADVNSGAVRVLIGSTEKMGAGTNVQERMVALHNLDAPWRPRDIEQRNGRGIRQGNKLYEQDPEGFQFEVHNYATEAPSFDVYMWQTLESKAKTITQIMKGDPNIRTIQDVDSNVLSYAEMKAIASGNPMILERVKVDTDLKKLTMLRAQAQDAKLHMRFELKAIPNNIAFQQGEIKKMERETAVLEKHPAEPFSMAVGKKTYDEPEAAGKAILKVLNEYIEENPKRTETAKFEVGTYRGFPMDVKMFLDNDALVSIAGLDSTTFPPDVSPTGLITRIGNVLESFPKRIKLAKDKIAALEASRAELQAQIEAPFEHEAKITELQGKLTEIDKALDLSRKDDEAVATTDEAPPDEKKGPVDILKSQRGSIPLGSLVPALKKTANDVVKGANGPQDIAFADATSEARFLKAKQGVTPEGLLSRLSQSVTEIRKQMREFPELPDVPEYSQLRTSLLTLQKQKGIAADRTIRRLKSIIQDFGPNKMDVFTRKVLLDDLVREAEAKRALPFGLTPEAVERERDKIDDLLRQNPDIAEAVARRQAAWRDVKGRYQVAMRSIGLDKLADRLSKEDYFRHQVLEYANERRKQPAGAGKELKSPTGRGFSRQRHGSEKDINANYLQADYEVMAQMEHDIAVAKTIRLVDKEHNIIRNLKRAAKQANDLEVQKRIAGDMQLEAQWLDWKQRIGMGMSKIRQALGLSKQAIISFDQLKEYAEQDGHPAQPGALTAFKAMSERRQWIKEFLGKDFQTWEDRVPEGYQVWQPEPGNVFFMAETIPHRLARQLTEGLMQSANISPEQLRAVLAMGGPKEQYVIPDEVYHTLRSLAQPIPPIWQRTIRQVQGHWKQVMLLAPRRFLRYNIRNLTGDMDAVFAGNPSAMKQLPKAMHELWPVFFGKDVPLTGEVKEWFDRGGFQSTLQVQEMGDLNELKIFRESLEREAKGGILSIPARVFNGYWKKARLSTDYREAMLRYANYLSYLEQMRSNATHKPANWGASIPENVMALPDLRDRAFKLSNELLGAYDRVSAIGQNLRNYWYPFFSWVEVNFRRYKQLIKNAFRDIGSAKLARLGGVATVKAAKWLLRFSLLWAALQAWNYLMFPDDEDELDEATRNRPHILFGRSEDGKIRYLAGIGAMSDLLSWFGLDTAPAVTRDVLKGKMSVAEALKEMAKAPVNKLVQGVTPFVKTPAELLARESAYPDVFHPRPIQDRGEYLAQQLTLQKEYGKLTGKPQGKDDLAGLVIQRQDPGSAAYTDWAQIETKFMEKLGKERGIYFRSPKSQALRNLSRAIQEKDVEAEAVWRQKYEEMGGNRKSMEASIRALAPLYGMSRADRDQLLSQLDASDRKILKRAEAYYEERLTQVLPPNDRARLLRKLKQKGWLSKEEPDFLTPEASAQIPAGLDQ